MREPIEVRALKGGGVAVLGFIASLIIAIVQVPVVLTKWSAGTYGEWATVMSVIGALVVFDAGHQAYIGSEFIRCWGGTSRRLPLILGSAFLAAISIACCELAVISAMFFFAASFSRLDVSGFTALTSDAKIAVGIHAIFWCIVGSFGGVLVRLYAPGGMFARGQWWGLIGRLLMFAAMLSGVLAGMGVVGTMVIYVLVGLLLNIGIYYDIRRVLPELWPWWRDCSWKLALRNVRRSLVLTLGGVLDQASVGGVVALMAFAVAPIDIAMFATIRTLANAFTQVTTIFLSPLVPDIARFHYEYKMDKVVAVLVFGWLVGCTMVTMGMVTLALFIEPLYGHWTRYSLPFERHLYISLGIAVSVRQWSAPMGAYLASINALRYQLVVSTVRAVGTLLLGFVLAKSIGVQGVGYGILLAEVIAAIALFRACGLVLKRRGFEIPLVGPLLAAGQVLIASLAVAIFLGLGQGGYKIIILALMISAGLAWAMWHQLPLQASARIYRLASEAKHRLNGVIKLP